MFTLHSQDSVMPFLQASGPDTPQSLSVSELHLKAAEFLDHASRLHREAARLHAAGESRAADLQVLLAHYAVAKVAAHVAEAGKRMRSSSASPESSWHPPAYGRAIDDGTSRAVASASRQWQAVRA
ncbi:MAG: hypothetical protein Q8R72_17530 [Hylemonella sp.]|nr:hypothetical protein [Hylemonella sp.]